MNFGNMMIHAKRAANIDLLAFFVEPAHGGFSRAPENQRADDGCPP